MQKRSNLSGIFNPQPMAARDVMIGYSSPEEWQGRPSKEDRSAFSIDQ
jgi:hypothetical protein